ncbi:MAG: hypothetical protein EOO77_19505 [Oxalobacteraceae bacterium]|nr:MAG: hypothetical protein EOO77_19505 [Oxalobacteraceae bacterium]
MKFPKLPENPHREWRAAVALIASIFGSVAMTVFAGALCWVMWRGGWPIETAPERIKILGEALLLSLTGSLVVLVTLGFAINRRSIRVSKDGFEASGGDGETIAEVVAPAAPEPAPAPMPQYQQPYPYHPPYYPPQGFPQPYPQPQPTDVPPPGCPDELPRD